MEWLETYWPALVTGGMIAAFIWLVRTLANRGRLPYAVRERIVTQAELRFYRALQSAVGGDYSIFAMVRIADLLTVPTGTRQRRKWLNKILAKHVDFVLCDPQSLAPRLAIELDDSSHEKGDRQDRDGFVDHAFESAGLPLLRIRASSNYDPRSVRQLIAEQMGAR